MKTKTSKSCTSRQALKRKQPIKPLARCSAGLNLKEHILPLTAHNAADEQTGALGDVQITLLGDDKVVTSCKLPRSLLRGFTLALRSAALWACSAHPGSTGGLHHPCWHSQQRIAEVIRR